ncbi:hypothetical protein HanHA300_Chr16g0620811 [Helianthus annuus]|uniref:uncharacterized protein LOC110915391 n=1 Tax=Helianthus annuus TaxID=4232 RepID=UPI000B8F3E0E|nr:uncharacterized protein LOC110915391 [Helianthus annuus]KAJ0439040.1 hypothetical protein HanHA300_Chr16g0620811 [Helianthus annuus]
MMNPTKLEQGLLHNPLHPLDQSQPLILNPHTQNPPPPPPPPAPDFSLPPLSEFDILRSSSDEDSDADASNPNPQFINPNPHISSQFYTFNLESHNLMIQCILDRRIPTPDEITAATPPPVLASWKSVWKDRNEETAYVTAWKRIQDKLTVNVGQNGNKFLCFKSNLNNQFVSHTSQWQDIVMSFHGDADLKHLGLKETLERIKQVWIVGAKFYGIPESYIRACVAACRVCSGLDGSGLGRGKRRRFEYTESFEVSAKDVPSKLQMLAAKHKVVLCIRQKYIRYKPFMAEVKDYACHRAGEPGSSNKKARVLKREPYASKRCGCGFRIRAIVPICDYNEKDKTFVYQEEGVAVFKLYAVHTGHEPGPLDGNARIMHRVVGHKGGLLTDQDFVYGTSDEAEDENFVGSDDGDMQHSVLQQVKELKHEVRLLEGKITKMPSEVLSSVSQELFDLLNKVRNVGECGSKSGESALGNELVVWNGGNNTDLIEDDDDSFEPMLGDVCSWGQINGDTSKPDKWLKCNGFDEKTILDREDSKVIKSVRNDETDTDALVGLQVDSFYPENPKWYDDSLCGLDPGLDCGSNGFRHGEIV